MRKLSFVFIPFILIGFIIPDRKPHNSFSKPMAVQIDGPYISYKKDLVYANYIFDNNGEKWVETDTENISNKLNFPLHVSSYFPGQTFEINLKEQLQNEESEYDDPGKILAISDIEGDFHDFTQLLKIGQVMDENFNWIFGKGHLVLVGDFLDRGDQVTEVLWLIYSLEEKAKAAGGYVHFILGNHEVMNLSGDLRYVSKKYLNNARLMRKRYEKLFDKSTELGRWLLTKNIMEKIGKRLFVHGGISEEVNSLGLSISQINKLVRPNYSFSMYESLSQNLKTLLNSKESPLWYRGYYTGEPRATMEQVNKTLSVFDVSEIYTGHTVVADSIGFYYNNHIINLDTHDYRGNMEALLIENDNYFRINIKGKSLIHKKNEPTKAM